MEGLRQNTKKLSEDSRSPVTGFNPGYKEYDAGLLSTWPRLSVSGRRKLLLMTIFCVCLTTFSQRPSLCGMGVFVNDVLKGIQKEVVVAQLT